ncbi:hypothetical protein vBSlqSZDD2_46 [Serratia phage vB_SlqS_ZDD2]|nr:hypothetical protein vBSlqSZDD2_46 [Serratia phage vB_SlqS_ZDD2]
MSRKNYLYVVRVAVQVPFADPTYHMILVEAPSQSQANYLAVVSKLKGANHPQSLGVTRITRPEWRELAANGAEEL